MFNVTVLRLRDLIKYFTCFTILIVFLYFLSHTILNNINSKERMSLAQESFKVAIDNKLISCIRTDYSRNR